MESSAPPSRRRIGRPLSFNRDEALRQAMLVFWRHGYETASIAELTAAMGITAPSLYAAFGDKQRLFLQAMHLYVGDPAVMERMICGAPSARAAAQAMLTAAATTFTGEATPRGCLLASATASGSAASSAVQAAVADVRRGIEARLRARIEHDIRDGALPSATRASALAGLVMAVTQGMSVLARDGATRASLLAVADTALHAWPDAPAAVTGRL